MYRSAAGSTPNSSKVVQRRLERPKSPGRRRTRTSCSTPTIINASIEQEAVGDRCNDCVEDEAGAACEEFGDKGNEDDDAISAIEKSFVIKNIVVHHAASSRHTEGDDGLENGKRRSKSTHERSMV